MATTLTKDLEDMVNRNYHLDVGKINFQGFHHPECDFPFTEYFRTLQGQRFAYRSMFGRLANIFCSEEHITCQVYYSVKNKYTPAVTSNTTVLARQCC